MISEEQLKKATLEAEEILMAAQSVDDACDHEFSPQFERKMEKLIRKRKHPVFCHPMFRAAAAIFLVVLLSSAVILSIPHAGASYKGLFYEQNGDEYRYVLTGYVDADDLRTYHLGWVPEGYTVFNESHSLSSGWIRYKHQENGVIMFSYSIQREGDELNLAQSFQNIPSHQWKETTINGRSADLFEMYYSDGTSGYCIIWMNEDQSILFSIRCQTMPEAIKIAENVIAKEKE
jgi:hypothetical protein